MTGFLLFTVYSPLASWGEITVGEARGSWDRPSRSAVLGLLGAGLGVTRDDAEAQSALDAGYGIAVRVDAGGTSLSDYHTTHTVSAAQVKKLRPSTRRELLEVRDRETILSRREYRVDALATVAVWMRSTPRWSLEELATGLRRPVFALYAGRRANALGLPADPMIVERETLADAVAARTHERLREAGFALSRLRLAAHAEIAHDPCEGFSAGLRPLRTEVRRDTNPDRMRWQFAERIVEIGVPPQGVEAAL